MNSSRPETGLIHSTAVIHPRAHLGQGVEVGPYAIIGADVILGDRCRVGHHASLDGPSTWGADNEIFPYAALGFKSQDLKYRGEPTYLEVGSNNVFREFSTVHRGTGPGEKTSIGNGNLFLAYTHVAHNCIVGDKTIFSNNATLAGHVTVGDHVVVSGFGAIVQFCRIGDHAIVGACTKIVQDVPPFLIADGNPAHLRGVNTVGLDRRGFSSEEIKQLRRAYRKLADRSVNYAQAIENIKLSDDFSSGYVKQLVEFFSTSKRGVVRPEALASASSNASTEGSGQGPDSSADK